MDPDPRRATARLRRTEVGSGKVRSQPGVFCFPFYFHPLVLFSPTSSLVVGEVRRGRGRQRRGRATSRFSRPAGFGFQHVTATRRPGCGSGSREGAERGVRTSAWPQFPPARPFLWRPAILTLALSVSVYMRCQRQMPGPYFRYFSFIVINVDIFTNCPRRSPAW